VQSGFRAVKIKIGGGDLADDVKIVSETRRIIAPEVALMVDYNQSQTVTDAIERIRRLSEFDLVWVEEPVCADDLHGHRRVRAGVVPVPIQTGENWWFPRGMANSIAADASDLAMVDIMKIGGVTGWLNAMGKPTRHHCRCPATPSSSTARTRSRSRPQRTGSSTSTSRAPFSPSDCSPTTEW
jgi:mandelate racemase